MKSFDIGIEKDLYIAFFFDLAHQRCFSPEIAPTMNDDDTFSKGGKRQGFVHRHIPTSQHSQCGAFISKERAVAQRTIVYALLIGIGYIELSWPNPGCSNGSRR